MTYDDWKGRSDWDEHAMYCSGCIACGFPPDRDDAEEPREVPEPDWDNIREAREEIRRERRHQGEDEGIWP